jgi:Spy/CpxP family protein refolding chaperone
MNSTFIGFNNDKAGRMSISKYFDVKSKQQLFSINNNRQSQYPLSTASFKSVVAYVIIAVIITFLLNSVVTGQTNLTQQEDFKKTLYDRAAKIVNTLEIKDSGKYNSIVKMLTEQYHHLNQVHDQTKESIAVIKNLTLADEEKLVRIKNEEEAKTSKLRLLHNEFITNLKNNLSEEQVEKVKDGMTYKVMTVTYTAYVDMIPALTPEQKQKIYVWLKEARELAMDEGSSDDKHKVFGKYKGRINNYLSGQGYDIKKEEKAWQERIKQKQASKG